MVVVDRKTVHAPSDGGCCAVGMKLVLKYLSHCGCCSVQSTI